MGGSCEAVLEKVHRCLSTVSELEADFLLSRAREPARLPQSRERRPWSSVVLDGAGAHVLTELSQQQQSCVQRFPDLEARAGCCICQPRALLFFFIWTLLCELIYLVLMLFAQTSKVLDRSQYTFCTIGVTLQPARALLISAE